MIEYVVESSVLGAASDDIGISVRSVDKRWEVLYRKSGNGAQGRTIVEIVGALC